MIDKKDVKVLYVDDEDINLFIFSANFKNKFNVITSLSGNEALEILEESHDTIVVVISDMRMPLMSGLEFIEKAREKYSNLFYFILTGFDYNEELDMALKNKTIHKYFSKPLNVKEVEAAINEAISSFFNQKLDI